MSGDIKHRTGFCLADGFDLITDSFSVKLKYLNENSFIRTQRLPKENGWLTRCLEYRDEELISLFCTTDSFFSDKNLLLRSITTHIELSFSIDIPVSDHIFHDKYALRHHRFPAIRIEHGESIIYLFMSGNMSYDPYEGILKMNPGEHELVLGMGEHPKDILRYAFKVLTEDIKPKPSDKYPAELANSIDTAIHGDSDYIHAYSLKKLGLKVCLPKLEYDESSIIHGMLPCHDSDDGSSIDTILYIKHSDSELAKGMFRENFIRGDKILLNSKKRRELCRMPRFKHGVCQYCKAGPRWLEKTVHGSYACVHCYNEANIPSNIPDFKEYTSDIPLLLIIYLGLDIPTFDDIPMILKRMSKEEHDSYFLGLLLYAACKYDLPERHGLYQKLMSQRNDIGIWHGMTDCCPATNAICAASITEYKRTE